MPTIEPVTEYPYSYRLTQERPVKEPSGTVIEPYEFPEEMPWD